LQAYEGFLALDAGKDFDFLGDAIDDIECQGVGAGFAVRKEDSTLRDALSQTILDIRADGSYKAMNDQYFAVDIYGN
ncbi:MAG: transporter substrate-binding domain-containing protein, partial [Arenicellales bacterium]|nr:transporter substrate-binding domain-containing protein [Arenicellales bacterium]